MPFLIYIAVALIAVFGVVIEMNVLVEPTRHIERASLAAMQSLPPAMPAPIAQKQASQPAPQPDVKKAEVAPPPELAKVAPAKEPDVPATANAADTPSAANSVDVVPAANAADTTAANAADVAPTAIAVEEPPPPKCDVSACGAAYFSFTAADCTYQPSIGPRRLCTKGTPPATSADATPASAANGANAQASAKCNQSACAQAYFTFNPSDCTFKPSIGPRRICTK
jgi:hypothetical protein